MENINSRLPRMHGLFLIALLVLSVVVYWALTIPAKDTGATWHNIIVGESTSADVIAELGTPDKSEWWFWSTVYHYYPDKYAVRPQFDTPMIVIRGGVVVQIADNIASRHEQIHLSEFIEKYGMPDYITWAHRFVGDRVVVFTDDGVLLIVMVGPQPETTDVLRAYYFRPCSIACVRLKFPIFVFGPAPAKSENNKEQSVFDLEDPWGLTNKQ